MSPRKHPADLVRAGLNPARHRCPRCRQTAAIIADSRPSPEPDVIRRRRYACTNCEHRFATVERLAEDVETLADQKARHLRFLDLVSDAVGKCFGDAAGLPLPKRKKP